MSYLLTCSLSQQSNCWGTLLSSCPRNVGVQDLVSYLRYLTLGGREDRPEVKKKSVGGSVPGIFL